MNSSQEARVGKEQKTGYTISKTAAYFFLALTLLFKAFNPAFFKKAALTITSFNLLEIGTNIFFLISLFLFFSRTFTWQMALSRFNLSYAFPFMSLSFVIILTTGYFFFDEPVSLNNIIGSVFIIFGTVIMTKGYNE